MSQAGLALLERSIGLLTGMVSFALLTRTLGRDDFGAWVLFMATTTLLEMWRDGLIQSGYLRHAAGTTPDTEGAAITAAGLISLGGVGIIGIGCLLLAAPAAALASAPPLAWMLPAVPLVSLASLSRLLPSLVLQGRCRFKALCAVRLTWALGFISLLLLSVTFAPGALLHHAIIALVLSQVAAGLVATSAVRRSGPLPLSLKRRWVLDLLRHGRYAMGTRMGSSLYKSGDLFLIGAVLGPGMTGLYSAASRISGYAEVPLQALGTVLVPRLSAIARDNPMGARQTARRVAALSTLIVAALSAVLIILGHHALLLLAGEDFLPALPVLVILALFNMLRPLDRFQGILLDALGHPRANLTKVLVALAVNVIADLIILATLAEPLPAIAIASIVSTLAGIAAGEGLLHRHGAGLLPSIPHSQALRLHLTRRSS